MKTMNDRQQDTPHPAPPSARLEEERLDGDYLSSPLTAIAAPSESPSLRWQAVCLLYLLYRQFHEGERIIDNLSDAEVLEIVHSWLANNDCDPYTNGGPWLIQNFANQLSQRACGAYWQKLFGSIRDAVMAEEGL